MAKVPVAVRLTPETVTRVDAHAAARGVSRQRVLESAVESFLDDAARGVPDLVAEEAARAKSQQTAEGTLAARHRRLAREMGWIA